MHGIDPQTRSDRIPVDAERRVRLEKESHRLGMKLCIVDIGFVDLPRPDQDR